MRSYLHYGDSSFLYAKAQICFLIGAGIANAATAIIGSEINMIFFFILSPQSGIEI